MLQIYNTLSRQVEPFKPLSQSEVKIYSCGPTVYNFAHLGNLKTYLFEDFLIRTIRFLGYKVKTVMNVTDIDDKTIKNSQKAGESLETFTQRYTVALLEDLKALRIVPADDIVPISSVMDEMILMIQKLLDKDYAYLADDGSIYYSIQKFQHYGELAHLDMKGMKSSVRINNDEYEKDAVADFALWKAYKPEEDGPNQWNAEFVIDGKTASIPGRPGWHIECSACNLKYFGQQIDIHMGGVDNIFPHHQNEIAQSEAFSGKTFSKYWVHGGHLLVEGKKMAKSAGNFYTLRDIYEKFPNIPPAQVARAFRLLVLTTQYRENFNFTFDSLKAALKTLEGIDAIMDRIAHLDRPEGKVRVEMREFVQTVIADFVELLEDDINTPEALARIHMFIGDLNKTLDSEILYRPEIEAVVDVFKSVDSVLGIFDFSKLTVEETPAEIQELLRQRDIAKQAKDYATGDSVRAQIEALGYRVVDTKSGSRAQKI